MYYVLVQIAHAILGHMCDTVFKVARCCNHGNVECGDVVVQDTSQ